MIFVKCCNKMFFLIFVKKVLDIQDNTKKKNTFKITTNEHVKQASLKTIPCGACPWFSPFPPYLFASLFSTFACFHSSPKPSPSFQALQMTAPVPPINYRQGDPIFTKDDQYFTIPQVSCRSIASMYQFI